MSLRKTLIWVAIVWLVLITFVHAWLNLHLVRGKQPRVGPIRIFRNRISSVTCHLTCPVTDFINKQIAARGIFTPLRFNGWPELKEAYLSGYTRRRSSGADAMALREQASNQFVFISGIAMGSAVMVIKIRRLSMEDLRGKRIAVPNGFLQSAAVNFPRAQTGAHVDQRHLSSSRCAARYAKPALYAKAVDSFPVANRFMVKPNSTVTGACFG